MSIEDTTIQQLSAYALGLLSGAERAELERDLDGSAHLRAELEAIQQALEGEADRAAPPLAPPPELKRRLMDALAAPEERYAPFVDRLARWMELSTQAMRDRFRDCFDEARVWIPTAAPGVSFVHFEAGPALAQVDTGFVRWAPHSAFPGHRHRGDELTFALKGTLYFSGGQVLRPGDEVVMPGNSEHSVWTKDDEAIVATIHRGFDLLEGG
ncbi:MAG: cupin domain-containing protein [Myxococcota bacterium]